MALALVSLLLLAAASASAQERLEIIDDPFSAIGSVIDEVPVTDTSPAIWADDVTERLQAFVGRRVRLVVSIELNPGALIDIDVTPYKEHIADTYGRSDRPYLDASKPYVGSFRYYTTPNASSWDGHVTWRVVRMLGDVPVKAATKGSMAVSLTRKQAIALDKASSGDLVEVVVELSEIQCEFVEKGVRSKGSAFVVFMDSRHSAFPEVRIYTDEEQRAYRAAHELLAHPRERGR